MTSINLLGNWRKFITKKTKKKHVSHIHKNCHFIVHCRCSHSCIHKTLFLYISLNQHSIPSFIPFYSENITQKLEILDYWVNSWLHIIFQNSFVLSKNKTLHTILQKRTFMFWLAFGFSASLKTNPSNKVHLTLIFFKHYLKLNVLDIFIKANFTLLHSYQNSYSFL